MNTTLIDDESGRYLPIQYPEEQPFWEATQDERLVLQRCQSCSEVWFPIGPACPFCLSPDFVWDEMSGRGKVSSYVVYHKAFADWLRERVPYAVVQVELEEGPRLTTNLLNHPPDSISIGMDVIATFEHVNADVSLVQFRPVSDG